jgi:hypothetical protein
MPPAWSFQIQTSHTYSIARSPTRTAVAGHQPSPQSGPSRHRPSNESDNGRTGRRKRKNPDRFGVHNGGNGRPEGLSSIPLYQLYRRHFGSAKRNWGSGVADHVVRRTAQGQPNPARPREVMTPGLLKIPGLQVRSFQPNGNLQGHRKPELV